MGKKRKLEAANGAPTEIDTSKPTAIFKPSKGRKWTLSLALPGSIVANAQSREAQALLAGQIARALAVFCVDEVVIFSDGNFQAPPSHQKAQNGSSNPGGQAKDHSRYTGYTDPDYFLAHILSYLECPPYLRRPLFERHPDMQHAGLLPSLDMPHHSRVTPHDVYREGVTRRDNAADEGDRTIVDVGTDEPLYIAGELPPDTRVTVRLGAGGSKGELCEAVAPSTPCEEDGWYWGYSVRTADSLSSVFTESPFEGGYDLTFGTSERGRPVSELLHTELPKFQHMIVVIGGVAGLEAAVKADAELQKLDVNKPESLFDYWVNLVPNQGSRTIRTEEAVWLGLMGLKDIGQSNGVV